MGEKSLKEIIEELPEGHDARGEYALLMQGARKLQALERGGVDNWEFYDGAMSTIEDPPPNPPEPAPVAIAPDPVEPAHGD
jgi:hypothetical protein